MLDRERALSKIDEFDNYLKELMQISPSSFEEYKTIEKKRSCERLLQLCIESIIDVCKIFVSGLRLGLPREENDLFDKMKKDSLISEDTASLLKRMRGLRNIIIHEYATVNDESVYNLIKNGLKDFESVRKEIICAVEKKSNANG